MLKTLIESLDADVFTPEVIGSIEAKFNEAVDTKVVTESAAHLAVLDEQYEARIDELNEKAEQYSDLKVNELTEMVTKYLDKVVDNFVTESENKLEQLEGDAKQGAILEAFNAFIMTAGVSVAQIAEAKDDADIKHKLDESVSANDEIINENFELKDQNAMLIKMGLIMESKVGLSLVEAEKFDKLSSLIPFSNDATYITSLDTLRESIAGVKVDPVVEPEEKLEESVKPVLSFSHLV